MADWTYLPAHDSRWEDDGPPTLVSRMADGKSIRRQKHTNVIQAWEEEYDFTGSEFDAAYTFFKTKYRLTKFTKLSYDVHGTPSTERSVYFASGWRVARAGEDWFRVTLSFERSYD